MPGRNYQRKTRERGLLYFCEDGCKRVWQDKGVAGPWNLCFPSFPTIGLPRKKCPNCERALVEKEGA